MSEEEPKFYTPEDRKRIRHNTLKRYVPEEDTKTWSLLNRGLNLKEKLEASPGIGVGGAEAWLSNTEAQKLLYRMCVDIRTQTDPYCASIVFNPLIQKGEKWYVGNFPPLVDANTVTNEAITKTEAAIAEFEVFVHSPKATSSHNQSSSKTTPRYSILDEIDTLITKLDFS